MYASFSRSRARSFFAWFFAFMRAFIFALRSPLSVIHAFCRASIFALISYIADSYFAIVSLRDTISALSFCFISRSFAFAVADSFILMTGFGFIGELIPVSPETLRDIAHTGASWNPRTRSAVRVREARKYRIKIWWSDNDLIIDGTSIKAKISTRPYKGIWYTSYPLSVFSSWRTPPNFSTSLRLAWFSGSSECFRNVWSVYSRAQSIRDS